MKHHPQVIQYTGGPPIVYAYLATSTGGQWLCFGNEFWNGGQNPWQSISADMVNPTTAPFRYPHQRSRSGREFGALA